MFDETLMGKIQSGEAFERPTRSDYNLDLMDDGELLDLLGEIESRLPATSLKAMDLERELVLQFLKVKELQDRVLANDAVAPNQQAQVANSVAGTLQNLVAMQAKFHTSERFKAIENLMIHYMKKLPLDVAEAFLAEYEALSDE
jgi:hypothetical protein